MLLAYENRANKVAGGLSGLNRTHNGGARTRCQRLGGDAGPLGEAGGREQAAPPPINSGMM